MSKQKILLIQASPRGEASNSGKLGLAIVEKLRSENLDTVLSVRDLAKRPAPYLLEPQQIAPFYTPAETHSPEDKEMIRYSTEAIAEVFDADVLVIATGMYSFTIAAVLKTWFDHISRAKVTFRYTEKGPEGLVKGKKVYLALASGGVYSEGPTQAFDFQLPYLRAVLGFLGMTDVTVARVEGAGLPGFEIGPAIAKALESMA